MDTQYIGNYLIQLKDVLDKLPVSDIERAIDEIYDAYVRGSQVFILGNGGSAATASHFACDLGKGTVTPGRSRWRIISLTDNVPLMTAWANDSAYEDIFAEQLANLIQPRDVVIGISGSGNSPNVIKALKTAREIGATTIGLIAFSGGLAKDIVDIPIIVCADHMGRAEDAHMVIAHIVCYYFMEKLKAEP